MAVRGTINGVEFQTVLEPDGVGPSRGLPAIRRNTPTLSYDLLVAKWDSVQPYHVRQAAAEYDQLGQDEFLARHGFGRAQSRLPLSPLRTGPTATGLTGWLDQAAQLVTQMHAASTAPASPGH